MSAERHPAWPSPRQAAQLARRAAAAWLDDRAPAMGAALAYYTLFSLAPLLLIVLAIAGWLYGAEAARGEVATQLQGLLGAAGAQAVQALLENAHRPAGGALGAACGLLLMLAGATTVFAELQYTLDHIWRVPPTAQRGLVALLRTRLRSFALVLALGALLIGTIALDALLAAAERRWAYELWPRVAGAASVGLNFALTAAACALVYKIMPSTRIAWRDVLAGALFTALLIALGREAIALYLSFSAVNSAFGAAGALVAVMIWVYYSAQIFVYGAEFTQVYAYSLGSRRGQPMPARAAARA